jgi:hypothetical protein
LDYYNNIHFAPRFFQRLVFNFGWFQKMKWTTLWGYNESILRLKRHQLNETGKGCQPFWQQLLTVPWLHFDPTPFNNCLIFRGLFWCF